MAQARRHLARPRNPNPGNTQDVGLEAFYPGITSGGHFWKRHPTVGSLTRRSSRLLWVQGWPLRVCAGSAPRCLIRFALLEELCNGDHNSALCARVSLHPRLPADDPLPGCFRRPLDPAFRRSRDLEMLLFLLPWRLNDALRQRFGLERRPFVWSAPPTRASFARQPYPRAEVGSFSAARLYSAITTTAGLIEWLLEAPEEAVGGLNRTYLLLMQIRRLRQLWQEAQRRVWPQGSLSVFAQALG